jgi:hypothetical protein
VGAGNAFGSAVCMIGVRFGECLWGSGRVEPACSQFGLAVVGAIQAAWRYSSMSPLHVECRRIGWPSRYAPTTLFVGVRCVLVSIGVSAWWLTPIVVIAVLIGTLVRTQPVEPQFLPSEDRHIEG